MTRIIEEYNRVTEEVKETQAQADAIAAKLPEIQAKLDEASAHVAQIVSSTYKGGGNLTAIAAILTSTPGTLIDQLNSLNEIAKSTKQEITTFKVMKADYEKTKTRLDALVLKTQAQQKSLAGQKSKIESDIAKLYKLREQAYGTALEAYDDKSPLPPAPYVAGRAGIAVRFAYAQLRKPYVFGAAGPDSWDCSGLTQGAWAAAGVKLAHFAATQYRRTARVPRGALQPGDLVFYEENLGHVGIYVGYGKVIHAPQPGERVKVSPVDMMPPVGYGRPA